MPLLVNRSLEGTPFLVIMEKVARYPGQATLKGRPVGHGLRRAWCQNEGARCQSRILSKS